MVSTDITKSPYCKDWPYKVNEIDIYSSEVNRRPHPVHQVQNQTQLRKVPDEPLQRYCEKKIRIGVTLFFRDIAVTGMVQKQAQKTKNINARRGFRIKQKNIHRKNRHTHQG